MRWSLVSMFLLAAVPAQAFTNLGLARYVSTAVAEGETIEDADARIRRLMGEVLPLLPKFLPE